MIQITPQSTVREVMIQNNVLFNIAQAQIFENVKDRELPEYVSVTPQREPRKRLPVRKVAEISMRELDTIECRTTGYEYFEKVLAVMLRIEEREVQHLGFIRAYRYFLEVNRELKDVAKKWASLKIPSNGKKIKIKRPNRGMLPVVQQYVQIMNGAVSPEDAWGTPWVEVFVAMESKYYDALEQIKNAEQSKNKNKR